MTRPVWPVAIAAFAMLTIPLAACGGSSSGKPATATATSAPAVATPTEDAGALATRVAASPAANIGPLLLNTADYPADMPLQRQQAKFLTARDVPGLASEASGFFATVATDAGDEFVNLIVLSANDKSVSGALNALTPANYLPGLTTGARDAATTALDVSGAPIGAKGFAYSGTVPGTVAGQTTGRNITGQTLAFVRGGTYVLLVHGMYAPSTRAIDIVKIAAAIDARLAAEAGTN
jgi:hypothetical protein